MARNFFEELRQTIRDQTLKTPGTVRNLHGVVAGGEPVVDRSAASHTWLALQIEAPRFPTLREFLDEHSFQQLPVREVAPAPSAPGVVVFPPAGGIQAGIAVALVAATDLAAPAQERLDVVAPGHQLAVYLGEQLVATGVGQLAPLLNLPAGTSVLTVLAYGGTGALQVSAPLTLPLRRGALTVAAPVFAGEPVVSYLNPENGSYRVDLAWYNDPYAEGWAVYRRPFEALGAITTAALNSDGTLALRVAPPETEAALDALLAVFVEGCPLLVGDGAAGEIIGTMAYLDGLYAGATLTALQVAIVLRESVATDNLDRFVGQSLRYAPDRADALARLTYGGDRVIRYADLTATPGTWVAYQVTAFGLLGESDYSDAALVFVQDTIGPGSIVTSLADDLRIVNGEVALSFRAPADVDYHGVAVYYEHPTDGPTRLTQELGSPGQPDRVMFRPTAPGTYRFRAFDWAGNIEPADSGVAWVWGGEEEWATGMSGLLTAARALVDGEPGDTAALTLAVSGHPLLYPVTVRFFEHVIDTPIDLGAGVFDATLAADGTLAASDYAALGSRPLDPNGTSTWWARLTDRTGAVTWATPATLSTTLVRPTLTGSLVITDDGTVQLAVTAGANTKSFGYTIDAAAHDFTTPPTLANFPPAARTTVNLPAVDPAVSSTLFVTVWPYAGTAGTGLEGTPILLVGRVTAVSDRPRFTYVYQVRDPNAAQQPAVDFRLGLADPENLGGTLTGWLNRTTTATRLPTDPPDFSVAIPSTPYTASKDLFPDLGSVRGNASEGKTVYFEFVTSDGRSTGVKDVQVTTKLFDIGEDGKLKPGVITKDNFAATITPVQLVTSLPVSGADGDFAFSTITGRLYKWAAGAWHDMVSAAQLSGQIGGAQLANSAVGDAQLNPASEFARQVQAKTQTAISGGGDITWAGGTLTWTSRFISIPNALSSAGYFNFGPLSIGVSGWQGVYYRVKAGTNPDYANHALDASGTGYFVAAYTAYTPPDPTSGFTDYLIGVYNGDTGAFNLFDGRVIPSGKTIRGGLFIPDASIGNAMITDLHGNKITANTITAGQIAADAATFGKVATAALNAGEVYARFIDALHIRTNAITADHINIAKLDSLAQDMGIIVAGRLESVNGTSYLDLNATGGAALLYHPLFQLYADGNARFLGEVKVDSADARSKVAFYSPNYGATPHSSISSHYTANFDGIGGSRNGVVVTVGGASFYFEEEVRGGGGGTVRSLRTPYEINPAKLQTGDIGIGANWTNNAIMDPARLSWYYQGVEKLRLDSNGKLWAKQALGTFSPEPPVSASHMSAGDWLAWGVVDAKKAVLPYDGIPHPEHPEIVRRATRRRRTVDDQVEADIAEYGKDVSKIAIGTARWADLVWTALADATSFEDFKQRLRL